MVINRLLEQKRANYQAQKVTLQGTVSGEILHVASVAPAK